MREKEDAGETPLQVEMKLDTWNTQSLGTFSAFLVIHPPPDPGVSVYVLAGV